MIMNKPMDAVALHDRWWADRYDSFETQTQDVEFLLSLIQDKPSLRIFEMASGTGRILLPLVRAGHQVTGVEYNPLALSRLIDKAQPGEKFTILCGDAFSHDWGEDYDVVVLAGNILINLEGIEDYKLAQQRLIEKAAKALKPGGYLFMDVDMHEHPEMIFGSLRFGPQYGGVDSHGVSLTRINLTAEYDKETQIASFSSLRKLTLPDGSEYEFTDSGYKHIPTREQVHGWIRETGLTIEGAWGMREWEHYACEAQGDNTRRDIYWAKKAE